MSVPLFRKFDDQVQRPIYIKCRKPSLQFDILYSYNDALTMEDI